MSSWSRRLLVLEAMLWLLIARAAILLLPFARIGKYLGVLHPPSSTAMSSSEEVPQSTIRRVAWAVDRAANILPLAMVCLPRGLAAWQMFHRRHLPGHLHFGMARDAHAAISSHVWLDVYGIEVTGFPLNGQFIEIGYYARSPNLSIP